LKEKFGCGIIVNKNTKNEASFRVNSLQDLTNCILPQISNYPLLSPLACLHNCPSVSPMLPLFLFLSEYKLSPSQPLPLALVFDLPMGGKR
jgi:hypothetical protein